MLVTQGEVIVRCALDEAWALFNRVEDVARLIPSVAEVRLDGEDVWARVAVQLGILPVTSELMLRVVEREPPWRILAEGWSYLGETLSNVGAATVPRDAKGRLLLGLHLEQHDEVSVRVVYTTEIEAFGRLRNIYQSILKTKAPAMMGEFSERLRAALEVQA